MAYSPGRVSVTYPRIAAGRHVSPVVGAESAAASVPGLRDGGRGPVRRLAAAERRVARLDVVIRSG